MPVRPKEPASLATIKRKHKSCKDETCVICMLLSVVKFAADEAKEARRVAAELERFLNPK